MRQITIRNLPPEIAAALALERARRHGIVGTPDAKRNGLAALAGTWTQVEFERFNAAAADTEKIDEDLWR